MRFRLCPTASTMPPLSFWRTAVSRRSRTRTQTPRLSYTPLPMPAQVALNIKSFTDEDTLTSQKETQTQKLSVARSLFHQMFHHYPPITRPLTHSLTRWSSFEVGLRSAHPHPALTPDTALLSRFASPTSSTSSSPPLHPLPLQLPS